MTAAMRRPGSAWISAPGSPGRTWNGASRWRCARGLLTHEDTSLRERGLAGSLAWDPNSQSDVGPSLTVRQTVGASATGGVDALLRPETARALGAANDGDELRRRTLEAKLGYGVAMFDGRYTGTPELGLRLSATGREYSVSWRLVEAPRVGLEFGLDVVGSRHESGGVDTEPEHRLVLGC